MAQPTGYMQPGRNIRKRKADVLDEDDKNFCDAIDGSIVVLEISYEGRNSTLNVHEEVLLQSSNYFGAALREANQENTTLKLQVTEFDHETVKAFVGWLYFASLPNQDVGPWNLYLLADKYRVGPLSKAILESVHADFSPTSPAPLPCYSEIATMFERLPAQDPMLTLLVDGHVCVFASPLDCDPDVENDRRMVPVDFWIRMAIQFADTSLGMFLPPLQKYIT
ncbi:hypothetical protein EJ05DRAFT_498728 [Pseudovirgaria hyperparasitica]|uniref:BTB domain-containing protein n=1 Tax=Pseudovirgaria hyperparasitica TaxID=470096 RepID=A0A6A6WD77_9PEZI|nr:uncharacterized protein EJ05DRAFT_498728 [Pseudovirgaria hyperparasitica]KAF2759517.1 hypothetical protein EJ05DRAFT_498728 [Pseudovirgaria hyperparasitica]